VFFVQSFLTVVVDPHRRIPLLTHFSPRSGRGPALSCGHMRTHSGSCRPQPSCARQWQRRWFRSTNTRPWCNRVPESRHDARATRFSVASRGFKFLCKYQLSTNQVYLCVGCSVIVTVSVCLRVSNIHIMITCVLTFYCVFHGYWTTTLPTPHPTHRSWVNVSLGDDEIDKLVVLCMNREFMKFGRHYYAHRLNEPFDIFGTVLTVESNVDMGVVDLYSDSHSDIN